MGEHNPRIIADGQFGEQTEIGVKDLQEELGFGGDEVDGKFGPATRAQLKELRGIDINGILADAFETPSSPRFYPAAGN